jgi:Ca2+-binding EF-hand superfamily protein
MKGGKQAPPAAKQAPPPAAKPAGKQVEKKAFRAEDYATLIIPVEEVRDIKTAFDIFDSDLSGIVDPQELKIAFQALGFGGANKFIYQILAELDDDQSGGIDFA